MSWGDFEMNENDYYVSELHGRDVFIAKLKDAILKTKSLNEETIRDYQRLIEHCDNRDDAICFQGIIAGLEEANRNLRICMFEVDRRIL